MTDSPRRVWPSVLIILLMAAVFWQLWCTQRKAEDARREAERAQQMARQIAEQQPEIAPPNDTRDPVMEEITRRLDELESALTKLRSTSGTPW